MISEGNPSTATAMGSIPATRYQLHDDHFCAAPHAGRVQICDALLLPLAAGALERSGSIHLSGASGRQDPVHIAPRPRRPIPDVVQIGLDNLLTQNAQAELCDRMGYSWPCQIH